MQKSFKERMAALERLEAARDHASVIPADATFVDVWPLVVAFCHYAPPLIFRVLIYNSVTGRCLPEAMDAGHREWLDRQLSACYPGLCSVDVLRIVAIVNTELAQWEQRTGERPSDLLAWLDAIWHVWNDTDDCYG